MADKTLCKRCGKQPVLGYDNYLKGTVAERFLTSVCTDCLPLEMAADNCRKKVIQDHAEEMYRIFIESDPDLLTSTCSCCQKKRELAKKMLKEMEEIK